MKDENSKHSQKKKIHGSLNKINNFKKRVGGGKEESINKKLKILISVYQ